MKNKKMTKTEAEKLAKYIESGGRFYQDKNNPNILKTEKTKKPGDILIPRA